MRKYKMKCEIVRRSVGGDNAHILVCQPPLNKPKKKQQLQSKSEWVSNVIMLLEMLYVIYFVQYCVLNLWRRFVSVTLALDLAKSAR